MRELTMSDVERLRAQAAESATDAVPLEMDEETFRGFYDRTARPLRAYLARASGDHALADDLLQECYYRFLRARGRYEGEAHRRNTLFRIATNLLRDSWRRARTAPRLAVLDDEPADARQRVAESAADRTDLGRAMAHLNVRERQLLWLAYAEGSSHREIAACMGLRTASVKLLLFRARRRIADLLRRDRQSEHERNPR
jgi:RNA polymerase sigma-70 factor (ECF subfamily)